MIIIIIVIKNSLINLNTHLRAQNIIIKIVVIQNIIIKIVVIQNIIIKIVVIIFILIIIYDCYYY